MTYFQLFKVPLIQTIFCISDEDEWRETIRRETEAEIERRVREALETPPGERAKKLKLKSKHGGNRTLKVSS